ncbi:hypothetical protein ACW7G0_12560 [Lysobacter sp. A286]
MKYVPFILSAIAAALVVCAGAIGVLWHRIDTHAAPQSAVGPDELSIAMSSAPALPGRCSNRDGRLRCSLDFNALGAHREQLRGADIYILGYLAIDDRTVSLFASENDYANMERAQSVEVRAGRDELVRMFSEHGYSYVRLSGTFDIDESRRRPDGRLGMLRPPFDTVPLRPRADKENINDIGVHISEVQTQ